ncbi:MAG: hypothetical protein R6W81_07105 [Bacteroidales bacterium]
MLIKKFRSFFAGVTMILIAGSLYGQEKQELIDYTNPDEYVIGGVTISGIRYLDQNALIGISGLRRGQRLEIPGEAMTLAVQKLWQQGLFSDVRISIARLQSDTAWLDIFLQESESDRHADEGSISRDT